MQEINQRRIEILRKRVAKFEKIQENRQVIDAQCAAIEDVLQLIRDQSVTMRDPQEVSAQLENLVQDVEQTEQSVREMEEIFALTAPESDELRLPEPGGDAAAAQPGAELTMSSPTAPAPFEALPGWARRLSEKYYSRTIAMFVLHGNVHDLVPWKRGDRTEYVPLPEVPQRGTVRPPRPGAGLRPRRRPRVSPTTMCRPIFSAPSPATTRFTARSSRRDCRAIPMRC